MLKWNKENKRVWNETVMYANEIVCNENKMKCNVFLINAKKTMQQQK